MRAASKSIQAGSNSAFSAAVLSVLCVESFYFAYAPNSKTH